MFGELGPFRKTNRVAFVNFLRAKHEMYTRAVEVGSLPYYLTLEPSDKCQLRCPTCVTGIENETRIRPGRTVVFRDRRAQLSLERLDALLDELGDCLFLIVFYNFGEPLLNRDLPDLLKRAADYEIETDINTNLSLPLSDDRIEALLRSGLDYLYVSIDGFSQETYEVHRVGGRLDLVKENLERLAATRDRLGLDTCITFNFLVFSFNEHEIPAAREYCDRIGIHFNRRDAFIHDPRWLPSYRRHELPARVPDAVALPEDFSHRVDGVKVAWSPLPETPSGQPPACSWHYGYSAISAGGMVSPCCAVPDQKNDFGRVGAGGPGFASVWNNRRFQSARASASGKPGEVETVCSRCPVPQFIHHMYSLHDYKVIAQYQRALAGSDPALDRGFDLFSRGRYGVPASAFGGGGRLAKPAAFFGREEPDEIARFIDSYETPGGEDRRQLA